MSWNPPLSPMKSTFNRQLYRHFHRLCRVGLSEMIRLGVPDIERHHTKDLDSLLWKYVRIYSIYIYIHTYVYMCIYLYVICACICAYNHIYIYVCIHILSWSEHNSTSSTNFWRKHPCLNTRPAHSPKEQKTQWATEHRPRWTSHHQPCDMLGNPWWT